MRCLLAVLLGVTLVPGFPAQEGPAGIPVVKTWEELRARPPINLGDGVTVRLGLEAGRVPQWSGALLYCLAEGYTPPSSGSGKPPLGPVYADFVYAKDRPIIREAMRWAYNGKRPKGTYLYVRALTADRVGTYHVTVTDRQGKVLARAPFEGTRDFFHPWMPWLEGFEKPVAPWEGIVLPRVDGLGAAEFIEPGKVRKGALPTFLPSDEKPALTIRMDGKEIVIRAASAFTTSRPERHFLARWWVNDRPFVPKQIDTLWLFSGYGRVSEGKELRVTFAFRPERLGAQPGDRIGLQLLHSESGWTWCDVSTRSNEVGASRKHGENVRVSNRIGFRVPKRQGP